ncbi:Motile sperm domain-containing protein 2 [Blomia tropicalis]|nr:Motile sperm domain-containing protein 2 [Blomia tropicalis]
MPNPYWNKPNLDRMKELRIQIHQFIKENPEMFDNDDIRNRIPPPSSINESENYLEQDENSIALKDLMLRRLLIASRSSDNIDLSIKSFIDTFKFRKQYDIGRLSIKTTLPIEFFKINPFICDGIDLAGHRLLIVRVKYYRKLPQFDGILKSGMLHILEQFDLEMERGLFPAATMVFDLTDFDYWANYNFELLRFMVTILLKYRGVIQTVLIYEFPTILGWLLRLIESWKIKLIHIVDQYNIDDFIAVDQRPYFLNGTRRPFEPEIPEEAVPFRTLLERLESEVGSIDKKNIDPLCDYIDELMQSIESSN